MEVDSENAGHMEILVCANELAYYYIGDYIRKSRVKYHTSRKRISTLFYPFS